MQQIGVPPRLTFPNRATREFCNGGLSKMRVRSAAPERPHCDGVFIL
jgi:hypothetical protein